MIDARALMIEVPLAPVRNLRRDIEIATGLRLKDRGEAHVTLVRPSESKILSDGLITDRDIECFKSLVGSAVQSLGVGSIPQGVTIDGLVSQKDISRTEVTFFIAVELPAIIQQRVDALIHRYNHVVSLDSKGHSAPYLNPHITIGFTHQDRYEEPKVANSNFDSIKIPHLTYGRLYMQTVAYNRSGKMIRSLLGEPLLESIYL